MTPTLKDHGSRNEEVYATGSPSKRRRISLPKNSLPVMVRPSFLDSYPEHQSSVVRIKPGDEACEANNNENISISASSKHASQAVAPFLAKHIPDQYAPMGGPYTSGKAGRKDTNTKYCYRHRPDLKCRRQANEPSMDQLQHELEDLSQSDQQAISHMWSLFAAAPAKHRNLMLQGILSQCCFPQLSYLSTKVQDLIRIDFLTLLPPEISYKVLCFLDTTSLCKAAQVSQRWRSLADDDVVWHKMCEQHIDRKCIKCGWGLPLLEQKRLRASKRQIQLRATGKGLNEWSPNITPYPEAAQSSSALDVGYPHESLLASAGNSNSKSNETSQSANLTHLKTGRTATTPGRLDQFDSYFTRPWKDVYRDRFMVGTNWKYGRYATRVFKGHTDGIFCLQFDDQILATGSYDTTIKIWDVETGEEKRTLTGHTRAIRCLQLDGTKLFSGSMDGEFRVWNWRTGECISTYKGHNGGIIGLHFDGDILATASVDRTLKIWNFDEMSSHTLQGHTDWVNAVRIDSASRTVLSASDDMTVRLWDLDTKRCIKTFEGHNGPVQQVVPLPHDFDFEDADVDEHDGTSSTTSNTSQSVPRPADRPLLEPYGPGFTTCDRPMPPRYMLTGALDNTIRLWDTYTSKCLRTYFGHVEGIWALAADSLRMVSGANDRMVKVWDTRSGKCERTFGGHAGSVTCIGLSDSRLCTGSDDCEVRMYSF